MTDRLEKAKKKGIGGILDGLGSYALVWSDQTPDINRNQIPGGTQGDWKRIQNDFRRAGSRVARSHGSTGAERK